MLLAQEFATGQSGIGYTPLEWKRAVPMLACRWRDGILESVVVPYLHQHNVGIFQHDNTRPHTARHTRNILRIHNVNVLQWPARSPDLSPIEHLWDQSGHQVRERHDVNNIRDLERALQAEWVRIPLQVLRKLICIMRRRCLAVLAAPWMVGTLGIEPCPNFYAWLPSSFHVCRRLNTAKLWNNIDARQILDSSKLKEFADYNFELEENGRKLSSPIENT